MRPELLPTDILPSLLLFRVAVVAGRFGSGKTTFAVHICGRLIKEARYGRVLSNVPLQLPGAQMRTCDYSEMYAVRSAVVIWDEAQDTLLGARPREIRDFFSFLRKRDVVLLLPSVMALTVPVPHLALERIFNGYAYALPLWIFAWDYRPAPRYAWGKHRAATYWMWRPAKEFHRFATKAESSLTGEWWLYEVNNG